MPSREARTSQIDEGASTSASSRTRAKRSDASEQVSSQTPAPSRRKSSVPSRSKAAHDESPTEQVQPQAHGEPAYPLTRVQKIVKMESGYIFPINLLEAHSRFPNRRAGSDIPRGGVHSSASSRLLLLLPCYTSTYFSNTGGTDQTPCPSRSHRDGCLWEKRTCSF
jgi:hypothetical protein